MPNRVAVPKTMLLMAQVESLLFPNTLHCSAANGQVLAFLAARVFLNS